VQRTICTDSDLSSLDVRMASLYATALKHATPAQQQDIAAQHRRWAASSRDACAKAKDVKACVINAYAALDAQLAAYASGQPKLPIGPETVTYTCSDRSTLTVVFTSSDQVRVRHGKSSWTLSHVKSASGARYASGKVSVWSRGGDVEFERAGKKLACAEAR